MAEFFRSTVASIESNQGKLLVEFDNADLVSGILSVNHNFGNKYNSVVVIDNNDKIIDPTSVEFIDENNLEINLSDYGTITGTWYAVIIDGSGNIDTSANVGLDNLEWDGTNWSSTVRGLVQQKLQLALREIGIRYEDRASQLDNNDEGKLVVADAQNKEFKLSNVKIDDDKNLNLPYGGKLLVDGVEPTSKYTTSFTNSDLLSGILTVIHNLGQKIVSVTVSDNNNRIIDPTSIEYVDTNTCKVDLSDYETISGIWNVLVIAGDATYNVNSITGKVELENNEYNFDGTENSVTIDLSDFGESEDLEMFLSLHSKDVNAGGDVIKLRFNGDNGNNYDCVAHWFDVNEDNTNAVDGQILNTIYNKDFTNSDLSSGILSVNHNLNNQYNKILVVDNNNKKVIPDDVTFTDSDNLSIDLSSQGTITGTWKVYVFTGDSELDVTNVNLATSDGGFINDGINLDHIRLGQAPTDGDGVNECTGIYITIPNFKSNVIYKNILINEFRLQRMVVAGGIYKSTSPITSITIFTESGSNFSNISRIKIYGKYTSISSLIDDETWDGENWTRTDVSPSKRAMQEALLKLKNDIENEIMLLSD